MSDEGVFGSTPQHSHNAAERPMQIGRWNISLPQAESAGGPLPMSPLSGAVADRMQNNLEHYSRTSAQVDGTVAGTPPVPDGNMMSHILSEYQEVSRVPPFPTALRNPESLAQRDVDERVRRERKATRFSFKDPEYPTPGPSEARMWLQRSHGDAELQQRVDSTFEMTGFNPKFRNDDFDPEF